MVFSFQIISCIPVILLLLPVNARKDSCAIYKNEFNCTFSKPTIQSSPWIFCHTSQWTTLTVLSIWPWKLSLLLFLFYLLFCCLLLPKYFSKKIGNFYVISHLYIRTCISKVINAFYSWLPWNYWISGAHPLIKLIVPSPLQNMGIENCWKCNPVSKQLLSWRCC